MKLSICMGQGSEDKMPMKFRKSLAQYSNHKALHLYQTVLHPPVSCRVHARMSLSSSPAQYECPHSWSSQQPSRVSLFRRQDNTASRAKRDLRCAWYTLHRFPESPEETQRTPSGAIFPLKCSLATHPRGLSSPLFYGLLIYQGRRNS